MAGRFLGRERSTAWWVMVAVGAGILAVFLLQLAVAVFVGLVRLLLIVVAVVILWVLVTRAKRAVRRR